MKQPTQRGQNSKIFISYRREDVRFHTDRLHDDLERYFGENNIFMDVDAIRGGDHFKTVIENAVSSCKVLLAVIGPKWLTISDKNGARRLDKENDYVRLEIEAALNRGVRVIPVLMQNAPLPLPEELPKSLASLMERQVVSIDENRWDDDVRDLIETIKEEVSPPPPPAPPQYWRWPLWLIIAGGALAAGLILWSILPPTTGSNVNTGNSTTTPTVTSTPVTPPPTPQKSVDNTYPSRQTTPLPDQSPESTPVQRQGIEKSSWNYKRLGTSTTYVIVFNDDHTFNYGKRAGELLKNSDGKPIFGTWTQTGSNIELKWSRATKGEEKNIGQIITDDKMSGEGGEVDEGGNFIYKIYKWEATKIK